MTRLSKVLGAAFAVMFVLTPAATSFAQEEEEAPLLEEPSLLDSARETLTEVWQEYNGTEGDSAAEQIMDDTESSE